MREWRQRFGYEYEVLFPGIRRLFTTGKEIVLAAEKDGRPYLIVDEGTYTDFNAPDFEDKHSFLASVLVAVHKRPPGKARKRPSLDDSLHRHEELVTALGQVSEAELRPVTWHALWRLPPGMVVADPPRSDPWMHYPAVSVVSSVAPLTDSRRNGEACS